MIYDVEIAIGSPGAESFSILAAKFSENKSVPLSTSLVNHADLTPSLDRAHQSKNTTQIFYLRVGRPDFPVSFRLFPDSL